MKFRFIFSFLFILSLLSCKPVYELKQTETSEYVFSDTANASVDSSFERIISPYRVQMTGVMNEVIGESEFEMEKGTPESRLGNFVADACLTEATKIFYPADGHQPDFSFFNNGGLRRPLPKGKITRGDVFELMPFENELVVLTLNGESVKKIFNFIASKDGGPVAGARFQIVDHKAVNITIKSEPLDSNTTYKALTSDYLANGGDSFDFLKDIQRENVNLKVRDAILNNILAYSKAGLKIKVNTDGRITNAQ
jgi:2',3'-cyclic-nucleotide 2'-phosphodiesterase (5'-nucleotidase family)